MMYLIYDTTINSYLVLTYCFKSDIRWKPSSWSKCSVTCGSGSQRRNFVCTTSEGKEVSRQECSSPQPRSEERSCDVGSCNMGWYHTQWPDEVC